MIRRRRQNKRRDKRYFSRTAMKTKRKNLGYGVHARGGIRA